MNYQIRTKITFTLPPPYGVQTCALSLYQIVVAGLKIDVKGWYENHLNLRSTLLGLLVSQSVSRGPMSALLSRNAH